MRRLADDHQQCDAVPHHGVALVRLVANAAIMRQRYPVAPADLFQPNFISGVRREVILMPFDSQSAQPKNFGELLPEIGQQKRQGSSRPLIERGLFDFRDAEIVARGNTFEFLAGVDPFTNRGGRDASSRYDWPAEGDAGIDDDWAFLGRRGGDEGIEPNRKLRGVPFNLRIVQCVSQRLG